MDAGLQTSAPSACALTSRYICGHKSGKRLFLRRSEDTALPARAPSFAGNFTEIKAVVSFFTQVRRHCAPSADARMITTISHTCKGASAGSAGLQTCVKKMTQPIHNLLFALVQRRTPHGTHTPSLHHKAHITLQYRPDGKAIWA